MSTASTARLSTSSTSSSSYTFPPRAHSPTKSDALKPNAHPYAIKTTSTALLSRSGSVSSPHHHHYVPASPSPTHSGFNGGSPTKEKERERSGRHRYSRSLTGEAPRPLPVPPSPTQDYGFPGPFAQDVELTPSSIKTKRADTLPPVSSPLPDVDPDLPTDPKTWTPTQLAGYLATALRVKEGDVPALVAKDIAKFVREKKITGRVFLRLGEEDLERYGINQRWRTALLSSSRALRQTVLRGRIWGFGSSPPADEEAYPPRAAYAGRERTNSTSSTASSTSSSSSRFDEDGSGRGRVRGMVASFERSGSVDEGVLGDGRPRDASPVKGGVWSPTKNGSWSPTKNGYASPTKYASRSSSPSKSSGPIFPHATGGSYTVPASAGDYLSEDARRASDAGPGPGFYDAATYAETGPGFGFDAPVANGKREPRLLPFPPTVLSPHGTGPGMNGFTPQLTGVDGFTPQTTGTVGDMFTPQTTGAADLFTPQTMGSGGITYANDPRPLPYPPFEGQVYQVSEQAQGYPVSDPTETQLHHPVPMKGHLVPPPPGSGGDISESEAGYDTAAEAESVSGYTTAHELQPHVHSHELEGDHEGEEELTMEQLLASSASALSTGAEAWELELGETVKRIPGGGTMGRVTGRMGRRGKKEKTRGGQVFGVGNPDVVEVNGHGQGHGHEEKVEEKEKERSREMTEAEVWASLLGGSGVEKVDMSEREAELEREAERQREVEQEAIHVSETEAARALEAEAARALEAEAAHALEAEAARALEAEAAHTAARVQAEAAEYLAQKEREIAASEEALLAELRATRRGVDELMGRVEDVERRVGSMEVQGEQELEHEREREREHERNAPQWPLDPRVLVRRVLGSVVIPLLGSRTPSVLSDFMASSPSSSSTSVSPANTPVQKRSRFSLLRHQARQPQRLPEGTGRGGYLVLVSIGLCAVVLRVLLRRLFGLGVGARRLGGRM